MYFEIAILIILLYNYYKYGISYAIGSAEYARLNNTAFRTNECWDSVKDEFYELTDAVNKLKIYDIFLEFFDTVHALIIYIIVKFMPELFYHHWLCWFIVFPFVLPASIKLGNRYNKYSCIRNHSRRNLDHSCFINSFYLKN